MMKRTISRAAVLALLLCTVLAVGANAADKAKKQKWAIQIEPVAAEEGTLPADFAMATYEELIDQITKSKKFAQVYRSGDKRAAEVPNLLILTTTLLKFERGSATKRAVTTVSGQTHLNVRAHIETRDHQIKFDKAFEGGVQLFGENLKATKDLAFQITEMIRDEKL